MMENTLITIFDVVLLDLLLSAWLHRLMYLPLDTHRALEVLTVVICSTCHLLARLPFIRLDGAAARKYRLQTSI